MKIPITIISGYLGSGKTTFINEIIHFYKQRKLAIIENEFGEIAIDNDLVIGVDDQIYTLANGCVCCSLNDDLIETIETIHITAPEITHLLIETTGIANPDSIIWRLLSEKRVQDFFETQGLLTIVDAKNAIKASLQDQVVYRQISLANTIIISKTDICTEEENILALAFVKQVNPLAHVIPKNHAFSSAIDVLELKALSTENIASIPFGKLKNETFSFQNLNTSASFMQQQASSHALGLTSVSLEFKEAFDVFRLETYIQILLSSEEVFRIKGILYINNVNKKVIFQSVFDQLVSSIAEAWDSEPSSKIVFIGKNLNKSKLQAELQMCCTLGNPFEDKNFYQMIAQKRL